MSEVTATNNVARMPPKPLDALRHQLEKLTPELRNALPPHISPEKFRRVVLTVVTMTPDLVSADRKALLGACMKCAADGLIPDGREAALVLYKGKPQYLPMVGGLMKRVRNSGEVSTISAHVVYENDYFLLQFGDDEKLDHKPLLNGDRGKRVSVYALAKLKDGNIQRAWLSAADVEKLRNTSSAKNGPWVTWTEAMWEKSAVKKLCKMLPMDAETERLIASDFEHAHIDGEAVDLTPDHSLGQIEVDAGDADHSRLGALEALIPEHDEDGVVEG